MTALRMNFTAAALGVVLASSMGCERRTVCSATSQPVIDRNISVRLAGSVNEITGIEVPPRLREERFEYLHVQEPSQVSVFYAPDRHIEMSVRMASIAIRRGIVSTVDLLPLPKALPYDDVIEEMHEHMKLMNITPDELMKEHFSRWPSAGAGNVFGYTARYRAGMSIGDDVGFSAEVRSAESGGWFLVLTLTVEGETRMRMRNGTSEPSSAPSGP